MKITVLAENKVYEETLVAEHGLSILVESGEHSILFDAGQSGKTFENAEKLGIDLDKIDFAVLSHGHYDHAGGFPKFRILNNEAKIYIHKDAICSSYALETDGSLEDFDCGIDWICDCGDNNLGTNSDSNRQYVPNGIIYTDGPIWINEDIVISGSVPERHREAHTEEFARIIDGKTVIDEMNHEQFLGIRENGKVYLFTGCSHNGPKSVIDYGRELFDCEDIEALIGGMHMGSLIPSECEVAVEAIRNTGIEKIVPLHCTGLNAIFEFKRRMGENCLIIGVGDSREL